MNAHDPYGTGQTPYGAAGPAPVSISGAPPKSWSTYRFFGALSAVAIVALIIGYATVPILAIILTGPVLLMAALTLLNWYAVKSNIGRPGVTAGPQGIVTPQFTLPWNDVRALEFTSGYVSYTALSPHKTKVVKQELTSVVITTNQLDSNGRPLQYGSTLAPNHTQNFDEFRQAVSVFAPHVEFRSAITAADYGTDHQAAAAAQQELAATGMVSVRDRKGRTVLAVDPNGMTFERGTRIGWPTVSALVAVTDLLTHTGTGPNYTERTQVLVIVTRDPNTNMNHETRLEYRSDYVPTLEQLAQTVTQLAPHVQYADQRRMSPGQR